jgi:hypothetical protein
MTVPSVCRSRGSPRWGGRRWCPAGVRASAVASRTHAAACSSSPVWVGSEVLRGPQPRPRKDSAGGGDQTLRVGPHAVGGAVAVSGGDRAVRAQVQSVQFGPGPGPETSPSFVVAFGVALPVRIWSRSSTSPRCRVISSTKFRDRLDRARRVGIRFSWVAQPSCAMAGFAQVVMRLERWKSQTASQLMPTARVTSPRSSATSGTNARSAIGTTPTA